MPEPIEPPPSLNGDKKHKTKTIPSLEIAIKNHLEKIFENEKVDPKEVTFSETGLEFVCAGYIHEIKGLSQTFNDSGAFAGYSTLIELDRLPEKKIKAITCKGLIIFPDSKNSRIGIYRKQDGKEIAFDLDIERLYS